MPEFLVSKTIDTQSPTGDYHYLVMTQDSCQLMMESELPPQHYIDLLHKKQLPDELQKGIGMFWAKDEEDAIMQMRETLDET